MIDTVSLSINLPVNGSREDYLRCIESAHSAAIAAGDRAKALALAGLLTMADEATAYVSGGTPHFFFPPWGRTA